MLITDYFKDAWHELWHHKLRTALTLLGMIFGVGAVVAMLSIGEGAEREALKLVDSMGLRNIIVNAKSMDNVQLKEIREQSQGLTLRDLDTVVETLPFVVNSSGEKEIYSFIIFANGKTSNASVFGVSPSYFELARFSPGQGNLFTHKDNAHYRQVAVIGSEVASELFKSADPIGQLIKVNHVWLEVVGVLQDKGLDKKEFEGMKIGGENNRIFIPLNTAKQRFRFQELANELDSFKVEVAPKVPTQLAAQAIDNLLRQRHNSADDFEIVVPAKLMNQHKETRRIFTIVMSCVAGISLLVGGIGIMNIMLASVSERTKEIGLLRAVGATKKDIVHLFMVESFTVSVLGGLLGIVLGFFIAQIIATYAAWQVGWSFFAILLSFGVCALVGLVFGLYPAIKASKMNPITALHSE